MLGEVLGEVLGVAEVEAVDDGVELGSAHAVLAVNDSEVAASPAATRGMTRVFADGRALFGVPAEARAPGAKRPHRVVPWGEFMPPLPG